MSRTAIVGFALVLSLSSLMGCVIHDDSPGSDPDPDPGIDAGPGDPTISPRTGPWDYDETTPVSTTCPTSVNKGEAGAFAIVQATPTSFHVIPNDGTDEFTCTLSGNRFACPDRAFHIEDLRPGFDAVLTARATANGTFSSTTRGTGRQDATVDCVGTSCAALGANTFPCQFAVDFVIKAL